MYQMIDYDTVGISYEQSYLNQGLKTLESWYDASTKLDRIVTAKNRALGLSDDDLTSEELLELWADWLKK